MDNNLNTNTDEMLNSNMQDSNNASNSSMDDNTTKLNSNIPKKNNKKMVIPIIVVLCLIGILIGGYFLIFTNPKQVFNKAIDKSFNFFTSNIVNLEQKYDSLKGETNFDYEITASDKEQQKLLDVINNIDVNVKYGIDSKNKVFNVNLDTKYKNKDLVDANVIGSDSKIYFLLKDITSKYIFVNVEKYDEIFEKRDNYTENSVKILNGIKSALKKSISDEDFKRSTETIKINGKDEKVHKNYLVIDNYKTMVSISKKFVTSLKNDKDFIESVAKVYDIEKSRIEEMLKSILDSMDNEVVADTNNFKIILSIYTKGFSNSFAGVDIETQEAGKTLSKYTITKNDNTFEFNFSADGKSIINGTLKIDNTNETNKSILKEEIVLNISDIGKIKININTNIEYNVNIEKESITNSVNYEDLKEEEINDIITKLKNSKNVPEFISDIEEIYNGFFDYNFENNETYETTDEDVARLLVKKFELAYSTAYMSNGGNVPTLSEVMKKYVTDGLRSAPKLESDGNYTIVTESGNVVCVTEISSDKKTAKLVCRKGSKSGEIFKDGISATENISGM